MQLSQSPKFVGVVVGGNAQYAVWFDESSKCLQVFRVDETAAGMTFFGPRIGKKQKNFI